MDKRQDELFVAVEDKKIQFYLSMKRNPFEIRLHLRTRDRDIGLARVDGHHHHINPDGTEIRDTPHIHLYREGYDQLPWAEPIDWYDPKNPLGTLERFLRHVNGKFPAGYQLDMF